ncbi:MAG TPA: hypothetical protein VFQ38_24030 [Longimicrobiales bacterium]|nr:hypothetical protein [Longimicrobiales bacterium]
MVDPRSLGPEALEILATRELRKAGLEPIGLRVRRRERVGADAASFTLDLAGRLECYGHRWSVLVECRNAAAPLAPADLDALRRRADEAHAASAILFTTAEPGEEAARRADELRIAVLRVVDGRTAFTAAGLVEPGQLPLWLPELTAEVVSWRDGALRRTLVSAGRPESILEPLRPRPAS